METVLAILMVLGTFVGIRAVIGFGIACVYLLSDRQARRAQRLNTRGAAQEKTTGHLAGMKG